MREKLKKIRELLSERLAGVNPGLIVAVPVSLALVLLLSLRSCELSENRKAELQGAQFAHSNTLAHKISTSTHELVTLLQNTGKNETIYHNNTLFVRTKNEVYRDEGINEVSRLKLVNKGRFKAVDDANNTYKAEQFSLTSFPQLNTPLQWHYNATSNSSLLIAPGKNDVTLAHIPMSWFHELMKANMRVKASDAAADSQKETFEWAVIHEPSLFQKAEPQANANANTNEPSKLENSVESLESQEKNKINLILANSDSLEFRQSLSSAFQDSGLLEGPARHVSIQDSLTLQSGLSVIPIAGTNLRLITKWTASWSLFEALFLFKTDFAILILLAALFTSAAYAYKTRFSRLSDQLITALANLNPSKSVETENSKERTLEKIFDEIFESSVWLYKIASQRQQKYSTLSEYIKSSITEEKYFLTYIQDRVELPSFSVTLDSRSRWRLCLLRSPYLQSPSSEVFFAIAADSSLARIIMFSVFSKYLEKTAKSLPIEEIIENISGQLAHHNDKLGFQLNWFIVSEEQIRSQTIRSFPLGNTFPHELKYDDEIATLADPEGFHAITFATYNYQPGKSQDPTEAARTPLPQFDDNDNSLPVLSNGESG